MGKCISHERLSETLTLSHCNDGFWLYDETRGMNLAMCAASKHSAMLDAIEYYQRRLKEVETAYNSMSGLVNSFVSNFVDDEERDPT